MRYFALDGTHHNRRAEQASMIFAVPPYGPGTQPATPKLPDVVTKVDTHKSQGGLTCRNRYPRAAEFSASYASVLPRTRRSCLSV